MRKWVSAVAVLLTLCVAEPALADSPAAVYSDFAEDGVLSCGHSQAALRGALSDASLYQYGDPLTFVMAKLAIRRQLAGGCRRVARGRVARTVAADGESSPPVDGSVAPASNGKTGKQRGPSPGSDRSTTRAPNPRATRPFEENTKSGGMVLLGVALLLATLASGGWAARRAYTGRE